jgi:intracellular sulfur oxidation DsrE/DsrF family protein
VSVIGCSTIARAQSTTPDGPAIHVDIPVELKQANVVFNMDHRAFVGDMPIGLKYMRLLAERMKKSGTPSKIIGIFHGETAYLTLNDGAYNTFRRVATGNPYKSLIAELQKDGVQIEECAVSMQGNNWGNSDLLPGVLVNSGAVVRLTQLVQQGYVQIEP